MSSEEEKNSNTARLEEFVNSSLDIATDELSSEVEIESQPDMAIEPQAISETEMTDDLISDEAIDAPDIETELESESIQTEFSLQEELESELEESPATEITDDLISDETMGAPDIETELEPKSEQTEFSLQEELESELEETPVTEMTDDLISDEAIDESDIETEAESEYPESIEQEQTDSAPAQNTQPIQELAHAESIEVLESEVSELESEIQVQMDKLVEKNEHLKTNLQSELTRVCTINEALQQQIAKLEQQLSDTEEKVEVLTNVQDRQQLTIKKLIRIMKGINSKITHLFDEQ